MPLGPYPDATCPTGKTLNIQRFDGTKVCRTNENDQSPSVPTCPAGATVYSIMTDTYEQKVICVPAGTATYAHGDVSGRDFPCRAGDYFGTSSETWTNFVCIPSTTTTGSSSSTGLDELNTRLASLRSQYTALASQAVTTPAQLQTLLPQIQSLNQQIATVLDQMLQEMQYARQGPNSDAYRTQLVEQLTRIQSDYNGLKTNTDTMQTLNRIRAFQDTTWQGTLFTYLGILLIAAIVLVLVMLFRRQKKESATMPSASPAAIPPLT